MDNAVLGKTMDNFRKTTNKKKFAKYAAKPTFEVARVVSKNLTVVRTSHEKLNRLVCESMSVLDQLKVVMYKFHYEYMMKNYPNVKMFTDRLFDIPCKKLRTSTRKRLKINRDLIS